MWKKMGLVGAITVRCLSTRHLRTPTSSPTLDTRAIMCWTCIPRSVVPFRAAVLGLCFPCRPSRWHSYPEPVSTLCERSRGWPLHLRTSLFLPSAPKKVPTGSDGQPSHPPRGDEALGHFRLWTSHCPHSSRKACSFLQCLVRLLESEKAWSQVVQA